MHKEYKTKQRLVILDYIKQNQGKHFTVKDVMSYLFSCDMHIGQTTVYRYLDKLVSEGVICKYPTADGESACYQYIGDDMACHNHYHLKCVKCDKLIHMECGEVKQVIEHIADEHSFFINPTQMIFYGKCKECAHE